jgi:uncharacterized membrane protein YgdD (TMEM256/DUF423 family)
MHRVFLCAGAILGFLAVAAGAFGTHGLEGSLTPARLATFETAARYQMVHALALVLLGLAAAHWPRTSWAGPGLAFIGGTIVFSGSLYVLAVTGMSWLGMIAPIGGVGLLAGWLWMTVIFLRDT